MASSVFEQCQEAAPIEIFALTAAFVNDPHPKKVNLGIGAYRTEEAKPWVLPIVRRIEKEMAEDETLNHEYLPILGLDSFSTASTKMLLGANHPAVTEGRTIGIQSLSGTGSIRVAAEFLSKALGYEVVYSSNPTWENHAKCFLYSGFKEYREYRYWDAANRKLDFEGLTEDLNNAPERSVIILHACAHNPTGMDPSQEEWKKIAEIIKTRKLFPFFDCAYQGFATGDLDRDAWAVQYFASQGFELICTQSYAKNFGLYNERVGNVVVVVNDIKTIPKIKSQFTLLIRSLYSNPPNHGARIVSKVLNDPALYDEWKGYIKVMADRVMLMRKLLTDKLLALGTPGTWDHVLKQIGMFSYTGLTPAQVEYLVKECHIYLLKSGRANMCGLNTKNVDYVANCIHDAIAKFPAAKF